MDNRPQQRQHLRNQMANILHALGSTFTTCACGARAKDCALTQMAAFVDGETKSGTEGHHPDLGPLVGVERGFMTREKVPWSGGMGGVEMVTTKQGKGEGAEVVDGDVDVDVDIDIGSASASESSGLDENGVRCREFILFPIYDPSFLSFLLTVFFLQVGEIISHQWTMSAIRAHEHNDGDTPKTPTRATRA